LGTSVPTSITQPEAGIDKIAIHEVVHRLETLAQHWEKLLYSTGGAINYLKSAWFVIAWKWVNGHAKLVPIKEIESKLHLTEGNNQHTSQVPQLDSTASFKTLGAFISPSGSTKVGKQNLRLKSAEFAQKIGSSPLSRQDAYLAYLLYFIPQIGYSLPVMTFTRDECNFIQSPALRATLSKLHLNQNTARSIIFGPSLYGGLSIPDLYFFQGIGQLQLLIHHLSSKDEISSLILIDLSYVQLLTGATTPFLHLQHKRYSQWFECGWVMSIWEFTSTLKLELHIRQAFHPKLSREHDVAIMEVFLFLSLPPTTLKILNACRCYLQVITVADIATADGKK
jgi:hypothetical protein